MQLQRPVTTKRKCLKCNKKFNSTGPGNRLCSDCNSNNASKFVKQEIRVPMGDGRSAD